ncbi:beta-lactamase-like protein [Lentinula detonsa]|uniref:Beta-lactamase-like protein n=1 Tax=Lentinula detonsa TaxID=2804962 RepID=A0A9W8NWC7_9AGAR|nr:beta-lactamase-like protein [Lentinula detonsa]
MTIARITTRLSRFLSSTRSLPTSRSAIYIPKKMLTSTMTVTFLGTSSGGGPSTSRNCSSLVADVLGDNSLWMVDCAEGTLRQFHLQPYSTDRSNLRLSQVKKISITHMHADHVIGIVPILRNLLFPVPVGANAAELEALRKPHPTIEIYGPAGIRTFVRSILKMTLSRMSDKYVVHELLAPTDQVTSCEPEVMHANEVAGEDIFCSTEDGLWRGVTQGQGIFGPVVVDAGPIVHRDPCIGYVFREAVQPFRKIVILGDTCDPSAIMPLCIYPSPSLLIHEAADAHIPREIDPKATRPYDVVKEKAIARGHSLPEMAGAFAKTIGAQKLVLNHLGGRQSISNFLRFPAPNSAEGYRLTSIRSNVIAEIERQASEAWGMGTARAAWDFMRVAVPNPDSFPPQTAVNDQLITQDQTQDSAHPTAYNTWETSHTETRLDPSTTASSPGRHRERGHWRTRPSRHDGVFRKRQYGDSDNVDLSQNRNHGAQMKRRS